MDKLCDLGIYGLATMGANLARNAARKGFRVALYNRHTERTTKLMANSGGEGDFVPSETVEAFVASLARPRAIVLMVEAGGAIDTIVAALRPLLDPGDILVDGGNSLFTDTERRVGEAAARGLRFVGMGVSGGEKGALEGPSMMPGGDRDAYDHLAPILTRMAAQAAGEPCCAYLGPGGAGHYVKMVHNGIEYADMQAIAEVYDLLRNSYGLEAPAIADVFACWRGGDLDSFLLDITVDALCRGDDDTGHPLVDLVLDEAEQKGTGRWTARSALDLGVVDAATSAAVLARTLSASRELRACGAKALGAAEPAGRTLDDAARDDLRDALLAARVLAFSQGFDLLRAASEENDWRLDLGAVAALWRGGCIIRARLLDPIVDLYRGSDSVGTLALEAPFRTMLRNAEAGLRRTVGRAVTDGVPTPVLGAAVAYFDGLRQERSPANLIQALRDEFGAHGYRRLDRDGEQHSDWTGTGTDPQ